MRLDFKPSVLLVGIFSSAGIGACITLIFMPIGALLKIVLCLLITLVASYHILDKGLKRLPRSCIGLVVNAKGELTVITKDGSEQQITVLPSSFVASYLTILNYKVERRYWQRSIVLLPDNVDAEAFRQLRVWLRWDRQTSVLTTT
jgi:toxin CptA